MTRLTRRGLVRAAGAATFTAGFPAIVKGGPRHVVRMATLAPDRSSWMQSFRAVARKARDLTGGEVAFKLYGGGVMGDEPTMIRKCRTGQLDGCVVTSVGLGEIDRQLLMLQLPLLFRNYAELDRVREKMAPAFEKRLFEGGFVMTGWGDVGFIYLFSNQPVARPQDIKTTKIWRWSADRISEEIARYAKVNAVPLEVPDVLPALQTGMVDAFMNSPYGAIALQWHTKAKYITDLKLAAAVGGSVLTTKAWVKVEEYRPVLEPLIRENQEKLKNKIRRENERSIDTLKAAGVKPVKAQDFPEWMRLAKDVRSHLTKKFFDPGLVDDMMLHLNNR